LIYEKFNIKDFILKTMDNLIAPKENKFKLLQMMKDLFKGSK